MTESHAFDTRLIADPHGLICAFGLVPLAPIELDELDRIAPDRPVWLHFNWADGRARDWLAEHSQLPAAAVEALLEPEPHVHLEVLREGFVVILQDLDHELASHEVGFGLLGIYVDGRRMISGRRHPLETVDRLRRELHGAPDIPSPVSLFERLVECLAETFEGAVRRLALSVEEAEDSILSGHSRDRAELRRVRWLLARLRRHASANRAALERLPLQLPAACGFEHRQSLALANELFAAVAQDLELVEDRARLLQEEIAGQLGETTNRNLYLLSIVTTAMLPITLVTGIFGMNVGGMPWLASPHGFSYVMVVMVLVVLVSLALINRARLP